MSVPLRKSLGYTMKPVNFFTTRFIHNFCKTIISSITTDIFFCYGHYSQQINQNQPFKKEIKV